MRLFIAIAICVVAWGCEAQQYRSASLFFTWDPRMSDVSTCETLTIEPKGLGYQVFRCWPHQAVHSYYRARGFRVKSVTVNWSRLTDGSAVCWLISIGEWRGRACPSSRDVFYGNSTYEATVELPDVELEDWSIQSEGPGVVLWLATTFTGEALEGYDAY